MGRRKTENKVDFKADYILKLEKREEEKAKKEAGQGKKVWERNLDIYGRVKT